MNCFQKLWYNLSGQKKKDEKKKLEEQIKRDYQRQQELSALRKRSFENEVAHRKTLNEMNQKAIDKMTDEALAGPRHTRPTRTKTKRPRSKVSRSTYKHYRNRDHLDDMDALAMGEAVADLVQAALKHPHQTIAVHRLLRMTLLLILRTTATAMVEVAAGATIVAGLPTIVAAVVAATIAAAVVGGDSGGGGCD